MGKLLGLQKTGFTDDTPEKYLIDSATIYKNVLYNAINKKFNGTLIGATNGGVELDITQKYRDIDVDGPYWTPVKGNKALSSTIVTAKTNLKEFTADNLALAINGNVSAVSDPTIAPAGYTQVDGKRYVDSTDYIDNICIVGKLSGSEQPIIAILDNCLATAGAKIKTEDDKEGEIPVELTAHADFDQVANDKLPYRILFPGTGSANVTGISLSISAPDPQKLIVGVPYQVTAAALPAGAELPQVIFASSNHSVLMISQGGEVTVTGAGDATIIGMTTDGEHSFQLQVKAIAAVDVTGGTVSPANATAFDLLDNASATIEVGTGTKTGTAAAAYIKLNPAAANAWTVDWESSDDTVATVTPDPTNDHMAIIQPAAVAGADVPFTITAKITNLTGASVPDIVVKYNAKKHT